MWGLGRRAYGLTLQLITDSATVLGKLQRLLRSITCRVQGLGFRV